MILRDNFYQFCIETYAVTPHLNRLDETVQIRVTTYTVKLVLRDHPREGQKVAA